MSDRNHAFETMLAGDLVAMEKRLTARIEAIVAGVGLLLAADGQEEAAEMMYEIADRNLKKKSPA